MASTNGLRPSAEWNGSLNASRMRNAGSFASDGGASATTGSSSIAITFDDGPHPEFTPVLLSTLAAYGVTATFFFIGVRAQEHPDLVRRVEAEGHAVGSHSMTHPWVRRVSCATAMADFRAGRQAIEQMKWQPGEPCVVGFNAMAAQVTPLPWTSSKRG